MKEQTKLVALVRGYVQLGLSLKASWKAAQADLLHFNSREPLCPRDLVPFFSQPLVKSSNPMQRGTQFMFGVIVLLAVTLAVTFAVESREHITALTTDLGLTEEQANKFAPIVGECTRELLSLRTDPILSRTQRRQTEEQIKVDFRSLVSPFVTHDQLEKLNQLLALQREARPERPLNREGPDGR